MSSNPDYNTRSQETSDCQILDEIVKLRGELVENFKNKLEDEIISRRLTSKNDVVNQLKIISLESKSNSAEQYDRRNKNEINGIPNSISDDNLESNVIIVKLKMEIQRKLLFALLIGSIANRP